jgi:hypothetical protein
MVLPVVPIQHYYLYKAGVRRLFLAQEADRVISTAIVDQDDLEPPSEPGARRHAPVDQRPDGLLLVEDRDDDGQELDHRTGNYHRCDFR